MASTALPEDLTQGTVTVLITDAVGSTELRTTRGDEAAHRVLRGQDQLIREQIAAHSGREVKGTGDGVLAAFASARRAVICAAEIQRVLEEQRFQSRDANVAVRIGVNSGEVSGEDGDLFGAAVNAAARVAAKAKAGEILVSAVVKKLAGKVPDVSFVDRGRFRLKGFDERWQLFEVVWQSQAGPTGVPARPSSFIGRKNEMGELRRLLAHTRMLTILGPGGAGKTRLATEFARLQASRFGDGQVLAELVEVSDPLLVADSIARAAGVRLQSEDGVGALTRSLQSREILLVVDNCEHLVEAAADVVSHLLVGCPRLVVLATSRERLNVEGETAWRLPPLALPQTADSLDSASAAEAVRLFVDRARGVRPGFDLDQGNVAAVVAICRRLDGMPLAIELAAARTTTFSPGEIMARLDDRLRLLTGGSRGSDARHRTLRATVDWSYELLESAERRLLQRFAVFAGSVGADTVEEICGFPPLEADEVIDGLQRLVDKSMLQVEPSPEGVTRYRLLETIRDYAAIKLGAAGEEAHLRDRHLRLYARLAAEMFDAGMRRSAGVEYRHLWAEMPDVRIALQWAGRAPDAELELLGNLRHIWMVYAPAEGLRRLTKALSGVEPQPTRGYVRAVWIYQAMSGSRGRFEQAMLTSMQLSELARNAGEELIAATAHLMEIAYVAERVDRDLDTAHKYFQLAAEEYTAAGDLPDLAIALTSLAEVEMQRGNLDTALLEVERGLTVALEAEDEYGSSYAYYTRGWLAILSGNVDAAKLSFMAALDIVAETNLVGIADHVQGIAAAVVGIDPRRSLKLFGAESRLREELEMPVVVPWSIWLDPVIAAAHGALSKHAAGKAWAAGRAMSTAHVVAMAREAAGPAGSARGGKKKGAGGLSKRELEVARLVASGMTSPAIAERLFLSERTIESHLEHILTKLGFNSRTQVAGWVAEQDIAVDDSA